MKPTGYTKEGNIITYQYDKEKLDKWMALGQEHGDVGFLLFGFDGEFSNFKGFGTIEAPCKEFRSIDIQSESFIRGVEYDPQSYIDSFDKPETGVSYSMVIWDASDNRTEEDVY